MMLKGGKGADGAGSSDALAGIPKMTANGVYDPETGALSRPFMSFREGEGKQRGYGKTAKLDEHPLLKPQISLVLGPTGSGKTTLVLNLLHEILEHANPSRLGEIMYYTGSPGDPLLRRLNPECVELYGPDKTETLMSDLQSLNQQETEPVCDEDDAGTRQEGKPIPERKRPLHVLVLDDAGNNKDLSPNNAKGSEIGDILMSHRHRSLHVMMLAQKWNMLPTFARFNASHVFMFPGVPAENKAIFGSMPIASERLETTVRDLSRDPHNFLWIDTKARTAKKGFSRVVLQ